MPSALMCLLLEALSGQDMKSGAALHLTYKSVFLFACYFQHSHSQHRRSTGFLARTPRRPGNSGLVRPSRCSSSFLTQARADGARMVLIHLLLLAQTYAHFTNNYIEALALSEECKAINAVLHRNSEYGIVDESSVRPWTLHQKTYAVIEEAQPLCSDADELLASLQRGTRLNTGGNHSDLEMEEASLTWFSPNTCSFRWYSKEEVCQILGRFSHVHLVGDSLMRHVGQAFFMLLRDDYKYGALPIQLGNSEVYDNCRCDGQFSEHPLCRVRGMSFTDQRQYGVCSSTHVQPFALTYSGGSPTLESVAACSKDVRPSFMLVSGGGHHKSDATQTIQQLVEPTMSVVKEAMLACPNVTFHVAWMGLGAQSRLLDDRYPHQRREVITIVNNDLAQYWQEQYNVKTFDVWNLTKNAPTSDGVHYLTDVNLVKALYVLNYMDQITTVSHTQPEL